MEIKELDFIYEEGERLLRGEPSSDWKRLGKYLVNEGTSDKREVISYATILMLHLLKCEYQPEKTSKSWHNSIEDSSDNLQIDIEQSKVLYNCLKTGIDRAYTRARSKASRETNLPLSIFPKECPYIVDDLLNDDWIYNFMEEHPIVEWK
jgi:hypothetical protein